MLYHTLKIINISSEILTNRLLQLIEKSSDVEATQTKYVSNNVPSRATFEKEDELIQFQEVSNILVTSNKPVKHDTEKDIPFNEIPDLYPVSHTVTLLPEHIYKENSKYRKHLDKL